MSSKASWAPSGGIICVATRLPKDRRTVALLGTPTCCRLNCARTTVLAGVLVRLIHKAGMRLRRLDYWAARMVVGLKYTDGWPKWKETVYLGRCQDTPSLLKAFERAWQNRPIGPGPLQASVTLFDLTPSVCTTPSLFQEERACARRSSSDGLGQ